MSNAKKLIKWFVVKIIELDNYACMTLWNAKIISKESVFKDTNQN